MSNEYTLRDAERDNSRSAATEARAAAKGETVESLGVQRPAFFTALGAMRSEGGAGGRSVPIGDVVKWAKTGHGGKQFELFAAAPGDTGCMRWGLCDTGADQKSSKIKS